MNPSENPTLNFEWNDYLTLAREWANTSNITYPAALYRSIISRSYYATYHAIAAFAIQLGVDITFTASDHYRVRQFFSKRGRVAHQMSLLLGDLYHLRVGADYMIDPGDAVTHNPKASAQQAIKLADQIAQLLGYLQPKTK